MPLKKLIVILVGGTLLLLGIALLVLPGPAFVVIPLGLAILATEFVWARRWLQRARGMVHKHRARRTLAALRFSAQRKWHRLRVRLLGYKGRPPRRSSAPPPTPTPTPPVASGPPSPPASPRQGSGPPPLPDSATVT